MDSGTIARSAGAAFLLTLLAACGGGGGGGGGSSVPASPPPPPPPPAVDNTLSSTHKPTLTGRFADTAIVGLHYSSASGSGTTDAQGQFQYQPGDLITFKIGDIALPPVVGRPQLRLTDFGNESYIPNNIARFLLGIDSDGNVANGFDISAQAHTAGTGKTLDFDYPVYDEEEFKAVADPIVAAAGGAKTAIVSYDIAANHLDNVRGNFGNANPVAGGWIDTDSVNRRAVVFLENGMYYSMEANCNGVPGYEFGTYTYTDGNVQLTVTNDADGAACGLNNGSGPVSVSDLMLSFAGSSWQNVSWGYGRGVFYARGTLGNPADHAFTLALLGPGRFAAIDSSCAGGVSVEFGDYESGDPMFVPATVISPHLTTTAINNNACSISSLFPQPPQIPFMVITGQVMAAVGGESALIEIRPSWRSQLLVGGWISKPNNGITFTSDGRYLYTDTEPSCLAASTYTGGEKGTYSWDTVDSTSSVKVDIDNDGSCGYANLAGGTNSGIDKLRVDGNLLTISIGSRQDVLVRNTAAEMGDWSGLWTRRQAAGSSLMTISAAAYGQVNADWGNTVSVSSLDSDCSRADSFSLEGIQLLADPDGEMGDLMIHPAPMEPAVDQPGCGLSDTVGESYEFNGDTLTIDGWGTFVREL